MRTCLTALIAGILITLPAASVFAVDLGVQRSSAGGVTVAVTPKDISANARTWDFKIVLDTHSQDLSDDLVESTVLLDDSGGQYLPIGWEGAPRGGHHREGTLKFNAISPLPAAIELQIQRPGEPKPRSFLWQLR